MNPTISRLIRRLLPLALMGALLASCGTQSGSGFPVADLTLGETAVKVEVAADDLTRSTGLMFRTKLGEDNGMLFVFPKPAQLAFWMHNTPLPLTVAFMDDQGIVLNLEDMEPQTDDTHTSNGWARYALEMNQGWFRRHGIGAGSHVYGLDKVPPAK